MPALGQGIHDIPAHEYHADPCVEPSLSCGIAKILLGRPPYWAWAAHPKLNPDYKPGEPKAAFDIGHAAHAALLENNKGIVVCPFDNWQTKAAREMRDAARMNGNTPVLTAEFDAAQTMAKVAADTLRNTLGVDVRETRNEVTMIASLDGVLCRTRPDIFLDGLLIDYKTTGQPLDRFNRSAAKFGYDLQAVMYKRVAAELGKKCKWLFLVQETVEPYPCQIFKPTQDFHDVGLNKFLEAHSIWKRHIESGIWPGYSTEIQMLDAMPWDLTELNEAAEEALLNGVDK